MTDDFDSLVDLEAALRDAKSALALCPDDMVLVKRVIALGLLVFRRTMADLEGQELLLNASRRAN